MATWGGCGICCALMATIAMESPALEKLSDLPRLLQRAEGFAEVKEALRASRSGVIDGAWGSSQSLAVAALGAHSPATVLVVIAHPGDLGAWSDELLGFAGIRPAVFPINEAYSNGALHVDQAAGQRLRLLQQLQGNSPPRFVLAAMGALIQPVPDRKEFASRARRITAGKPIDLEELSAWLVEHGYQRVDAVEYPAEFSRRGGIMDIFSPDADAPFRLEMFGDEVESIRQFSAQSQRSLQEMTELAVLGLRIADSGLPIEDKKSAIRIPNSGMERGHLADYLPADSWVVLIEPGELREQGRLFLDRAAEQVGLFQPEGVFEQLTRRPSVTISAFPQASIEATCHLHVESVERFSGNVGRVRDELDSVARQERVLVACQNDGECRRLNEVLAAGQLAQSQRPKLVTGRVRAGFRLIEPGIVVLGSQELFHREAAELGQPASADYGPPKRRVESRAIDSFLDLSEGDFVVHVSHGIAKYHGMHMLNRGQGTGDREQGRKDFRQSHAGDMEADSSLSPVPCSLSPIQEEHLLLEFRNGVFVYVPASKIDLVQKYVGSSQSEPELSKFGGTGWQNRKEKVEAAVMDLAADMLELQAVRASQPGDPLPADTEWQKEFEASFPYRETPDQLTSLVEIKMDLGRARPMDRLLCGDVGYGKTELAVRAAFKAIDNGKQVAVLVPTTVLAERAEMLLGKHRGRHEHGDLPAVVDRLERRADRQLGLAVADVAAD